MNLNGFGMMLMSVYSFLHFFTLWHAQNSRNVFFQRNKKRLRQAETPLKKAWGGTGDNSIQYNTIQYNTISPISPPTPPHAGGGGHGVGGRVGILGILYCIVSYCIKKMI